MKLTSTQKIILIAVALVAIAAAIFFLAIVPQFSRLGTLDAQIVQAEQDIQSAQTLLEQRQQIKSRSAETETRLLSLSNELPESPELPAVIIELQDAVNASGLDFVAITPQLPEVREGYSAIKLEMRVTGGWPDYVDLLQRLRKVKRQIRITGISVGRDDSASESTSTVEPETIVNGQISLEVYTMASAAEAAPPAALPAPAQ